MKTKFTNKDYIRALKVRIRSALIEFEFEREDFQDGYIEAKDLIYFMKIKLEDLNSLIEQLECKS